MRHERFCQLYAGKCFGFANKAYTEAGYRPKSDETARVEGCKFLTNPNIWDRIQYLRKAQMKALAIDQKRILELRLQIAYDKNEISGTRLAALKDVERSLGLETPEKHEMEITGSVIVIK